MKIGFKSMAGGRKGFTLIELLVVVSIIGLLASVTLVSMSGARGKARDSRRFSDFRQIGPAQENVMNDSYAYFSSPQVVGTLPAIKNSLNYQYLVPITDPINDATYQYVWVANNAACGTLTAGTYYCALTKLENKGECGAGENHYFVVNNISPKEFCSSTDYVASPPNCSTCLAF